MGGLSFVFRRPSYEILEWFKCKVSLRTLYQLRSLIGYCVRSVVRGGRGGGGGGWYRESWNSLGTAEEGQESLRIIACQAEIRAQILFFFRIQVIRAVACASQRGDFCRYSCSEWGSPSTFRVSLLLVEYADGTPLRRRLPGRHTLEMSILLMMPRPQQITLLAAAS